MERKREREKCMCWWWLLLTPRPRCGRGVVCEQQVDVMISPTLGAATPPLSKEARECGESNSGLILQMMKYVFLGNLLGYPAISVPVGYGPGADQDTDEGTHHPSFLCFCFCLCVCVCVRVCVCVLVGFLRCVDVARFVAWHGVVETGCTPLTLSIPSRPQPPRSVHFSFTAMLVLYAAVRCPAGVLPIGMQIMADHWNDGLLLQLAAQLEAGHVSTLRRRPQHFYDMRLDTPAEV